MIIQISTGIGKGPTELSAFDAALNAAGVANFNLIRLSSVIPPKTKIITYKGKIDDVQGKWGDRLYVVMADKRVDTPNTEAWAGVGWIYDKTTNLGMFAEHTGSSEATVRLNIKQSLEAFASIRKNELVSYKMNMAVTGLMCTKEPVCALAVAAYSSSGWQSKLKFVK
ncbi:hypothetical protein A3J32_01480 [Candidatus Saccharibacteria bacterium RIFCSPLOWO2_02_FULL_46_7]|nr:MAG: hypothetical protein A3J32_01480 [Candidatus Saccharibacteria bacterium RIFCSPLOWO2_02_FULL_46_7]